MPPNANTSQRHVGVPQELQVGSGHLPSTNGAPHAQRPFMLTPSYSSLNLVSRTLFIIFHLSNKKKRSYDRALNIENPSEPFVSQGE
jgi:hypothetical protein